MKIEITAPADGSIINGSEVMVKGHITNATGNETGINIRGNIALLSNNEFLVNHVPLTGGVNTITVNAKDTAGAEATKSITVNAVPVANYIRISAIPESAMATMDVLLRINGSFTISNPVITVNGPGSAEQLQSNDPEEYSYRINAEGIYYFTAQAIGPDGNTYHDTIAVVVYDKATLDAQLKAKWNGMKTALINNDIEGALNYFRASSKEKYREFFNSLINEISGIASEMREIEMVSSNDIVTKYRINREVIIQGQKYDITNDIYFVKDLDGLWRIESY